MVYPELKSQLLQYQKQITQHLKKLKFEGATLRYSIRYSFKFKSGINPKFLTKNQKMEQSFISLYDFY